MKGLLAGDYDAALLLTEAAVAAALSPPHAIRIAGGWVDTPLTWGIYVHPDSPHALPTAAATAAGKDAAPRPPALPLDQSPRPLTWGISRPQSGSHTLALLHTRGHPHPPAFATCGNMDGLLAGIADRTVDVFLWERATTAPAVEAVRVALAGTVVPGWPAFCVAVCANAPEDVVGAVQAAVATAAVAAGSMLAAAGGDAAGTVGGGGGGGSARKPGGSRVWPPRGRGGVCRDDILARPGQWRRRGNGQRRGGQPCRRRTGGWRGAARGDRGGQGRCGAGGCGWAGITGRLNNCGRVAGVEKGDGELRALLKYT